MVPITGNTFGVREQLKRMGCKWSPSRKCWVAPTQEIATQAQAIVPASKGVGRAPRTCVSCGQRINYGKFCGKCEYA
jgi:hypothetical protein